MMKKEKFWKIICILAVIAYTVKSLFIGADMDEGYGIMAGYRLAMGDRLLLEMWEPHQTSAIFTAVFIKLFMMMTGGISLRASGLAPERFIAVFYTGLGGGAPAGRAAVRPTLWAGPCRGRPE